jgi:hypothetical protein
MNTTRALVALVLVLFALSCSENQFGGISSAARQKNKPAADGERDSDSNSSELGQTANGELDTDSEDDVADRPAVVSGAYLTCIEDGDVAGTTSEQAGVGCAVKTGDQKLALDASTQLSWVLWDALANQPLAATFTKVDDAGSPYHATGLVPRAQINHLLVRVDVAKDAQRSSLWATIQPRGEAGQSEAAPAVVEVGTTDDFHLGENNYAGDRDFGCHDDLQAIKALGAKMRIVFNVKSAASDVAIRMEGMCGVTRDQNAVRLLKGDQVVQEKLIPIGARWVNLEPVAAEAGEYTLEIESGLLKYRDGGRERQDYDDFVVSKVVFTSDAAVEIVSAGAGTP